jgi:hypothetical protein
MKKFPKKLTEGFDLIRKGKVADGMKMLEEVPDFEPQKNMALAEVAYFQHDWGKGLKLSCAFMPHPNETHYSNIFDEHFELILLATYKLNLWKQTLDFFTDLLKIYKKIGNKQVVFQIEKKIDQIKDKEATIDEFKNAKPKIRTTGKSLEEIIEQQQKFKPKLNNKEVEKADYILYFLHYNGKTEDFVKVYSKLGKELYAENHQRAAKEYIALGDLKNAQKALMNFVQTWWPVEKMQVVPLILMTHKELLPALDKKFCEEVLKTPKMIKE